MNTVYKTIKLQDNVIYCFWTGTNLMSHQRELCLQGLVRNCGVKVVFIKGDDYKQYILPEHPLHPAYEYLSETHKSDYLRTYLMNFYGGGYSDIKRTTAPWNKSFEELYSSDKWICGYRDFQEGIAYKPFADKWRDLVGNGAYICKANTPLTNEWYSEMISLLDTKLEQLKANPATFPQDCSEKGTGYPIGWNEMLGRIFHKVCYKYKERLMNTLPESVFENYR